MKNISLILNKIKYLIYQYLVLIKSKFLELISYSFVIVIFYRFVNDLSIIGLISMIISFVISFIISNFILNNFKFSRYILVRIIQKLVIYSICFILCIYISSYFGLNIINEILCAGDDNVKEAKDLVKVQSVDNNNKTTY